VPTLPGSAPIHKREGSDRGRGHSRRSNLTLASLREACPFPKGEGIWGDRLRLKTGVNAPTP
jgi:hypothetical protein